MLMSDHDDQQPHHHIYFTTVVVLRRPNPIRFRQSADLPYTVTVCDRDHFGDWTRRLANLSPYDLRSQSLSQ